MLERINEQLLIRAKLSSDRKVINKQGIHINLEESGKVSLALFLPDEEELGMAFSLDVYFNTVDDFIDFFRLQQLADLDLIDADKLWECYYMGNGHFVAEIDLDSFFCRHDIFTGHTEIYCEDLFFFDHIPSNLNSPDDFISYYKANSRFLEHVSERADELNKIRNSNSEDPSR